MNSKTIKNLLFVLSLILFTLTVVFFVINFIPFLQEGGIGGSQATGFEEPKSDVYFLGLTLALLWGLPFSIAPLLAGLFYYGPSSRLIINMSNMIRIMASVLIIGFLIFFITDFIRIPPRSLFEALIMVIGIISSGLMFSIPWIVLLITTVLLKKRQYPALSKQQIL